MNTALVKGLTLASVSLMGLLTTHAASAVSADEGPRTAVVHYQDLDLSQPNDVKRLYDRIKSAAREVCDDDPGSDLKRLAMYKSCVRDAVNKAVWHVRSPQLTNIRQAELHRLSGG